MLNFDSPPFVWQEQMKILMDNVSLDEILFNADNSILFVFSDTCEGNPYKNLLCKNVWKFTEDSFFESEDVFPIFICDVRVAKLEGKEIRNAFNHLRYGFGDIPSSDEYN